ncbi:MAG TPA: dUTP diphosphatase [Candidatus Mcinerneyibacterium sp.]|nr:dUTP diphosphatase [Candidatus Mcinerneyibacterium sp.]
MTKVKVKLYKNEKAKNINQPEYMTKFSSGMDIRSAEENLIHPGNVELIKTGIHVEVPKGFEIQIRPRSGLALNYGIAVLNSPGTIDSDYRGEIGIILANFGNDKFLVEKGMRIAQMVLSKVYHIEWEEVEQLNDSKRGKGGFGHTGS